ncbi:hypothetical protein I4U23_023557 [Adineta vaga]|nr:hypothetical protein I4U23_023557 [Adineta vaga]
MYGHNLYGNVSNIISLDSNWRYIRSYLLHVGLALLYHSFFLLACLRFFRIVLYKYKRLQRFEFIFAVVFIEWFIDFLSMAPLLIQKWVKYISGYYFCELLFSNFLPTAYAGMIAYVIPINGFIMIYIYIIHYMKKNKSQSILQNRQRTNQRDFIVLRRIITMIGLFVILCFPSFFTMVKFCNYWL